jgi:hypothetical protein
MISRTVEGRISSTATAVLSLTQLGLDQLMEATLAPNSALVTDALGLQLRCALGAAKRERWAEVAPLV